MSKVLLTFLLVLSTILGSSITFVVIAIFFGGDVQKLLTADPFLLSDSTSKLSYVDQLRVDRLIEKNLIFSSEDLLGQIGSFYSTIILVLVTLITIVSLFTYFFVKGSAEEKAEAQAKAVAKQVVDDKISPKLSHLDDALQRISEDSLNSTIDVQLQHKLFDSLSFWSKVEAVIYSKNEEALEDYSISSIKDDLAKHQLEIEKITAAVQDINALLEASTASDEGNVVDIGTQ